MTPQQIENFAERIAVALVPLIKFEGTPQEMDSSAQAWVSRSRNLAKLWAVKAPASKLDAEAAYTAELQEISDGVAQRALERREAKESTLEELGKADNPDSEAALMAQLPRRKRK